MEMSHHASIHTSQPGFKIDGIVWKSERTNTNTMEVERFKIDGIVWKYVRHILLRTFR